METNESLRKSGSSRVFLTINSKLNRRAKLLLVSGHVLTLASRAVKEIKCLISLHGQTRAMLLGLFKKINGYVSDSLKLVYTWRIRHGCRIKSEEVAQHRMCVF